MAPGFASVFLFRRGFGAVVDALVRTVETRVAISIVTELMTFLPELVLDVVTERCQEPAETEIVPGRSRLAAAFVRDGLEAHVDAIVELFFASGWVSVVPQLVAFRRLIGALLDRVAYLAEGAASRALFTRFLGIVTTTTDGETQQ